MFEKPIDRNISGVIKVGQKDEEIIYQELDEYVVTKQLLKHFREFFDNYATSIDNPNGEIGVWISGFFGSGKSHFLKILSYILDSTLTVNDRTPISFFEEKIDDSTIIANMKKSSSVSTDVRLFNIDSKSSSRKDNDAIVKVFLKEFNALRGYCDNENFFIADLERKLDEKNKFMEFQEEFEKITGTTWIDGRDDFDFISEDVKEALVNIEFMDEKQADHWIENSENNYHITIEKLSKDINEYCESKDPNHHIIFLIDEVGQYIGDNTQLMLTLQTLVEDLGTNCNGKVWVVVTSQQDIGEIVKNVKDQDFSKIQGRFKTRINLTSSNVDEVIRRRILEKTETAQETLKSQYSNIEYTLKNILTFDNKAELKEYHNSEEYAEVYPFIPYQFNLLQEVLTSVRLHSATGKHLAEGERSMLGLFQEAAKTYKEQDDTTIIPFYSFYDPLEKWIDSDKSRVIDHAKENQQLEAFDIKVLKSLLMIKHIDEIEANLTNIITLTIDNTNTDRTILGKQVEKSLQKLFDETLIGKNGDKYTFLTNEEQDTNRAIKHEQIDESEITSEIYEKIYDGLLVDLNKYQYDKSHNFEFNKSIDNYTKGHGNKDMGLRIITPQYEYNTNIDDDQTRHNALRELSQNKHEAIFQFKNDNIIEDIRTTLQIQKYLRKNTELSATIRETKNTELQEQKNRIDIQLEESIKTATIYIDGHQVNIEEKHSQERINEALSQLCKKIYNKLEYMELKPEKSDIKKLLEQKTNDNDQEFIDYKYNLILKNVEDYLNDKKTRYENVYLKDLIQRYTKAPYGYNPLEIEWIIIKLFTQKRINITYSTTDFNEYTTDKKITIITQAKNYEKLLIEKRKQTSQRELNELKEILLEITEINVPDKEIITTLQKELNKIYEQLNTIKNKYTNNSRYPNKEKVQKAHDLYSQLQKNEKEEIFIEFVLKNQDELLDYNEELGSTFEFFRGNQWELFDKGIKVTKTYEDNQFNIDNTQIEETYQKILNIINNPQPFNEIPQLAQLCEQFNNQYDEELNKLRKPIIEKVNESEKTILNKLSTSKLQEEFTKPIETEYQKLRHKKETTKNISIITDENEYKNLENKYNKKIQQFIEKQNKERIPGPTTPPIPEPELEPVIAKTIYLKELQLNQQTEIDNEEKLNEFIEKLKEELKKELNKNEKINIQL